MPPSPIHSQNAAPPCSTGTNRNMQRRQPDRERGAAEEEIGHRVRIVDAGLDHPAAQHLGFVGVARRIVLGGVFDARAARLSRSNAAASGCRRSRSMSSTRPMLAARRLTEPCTRTTAMTLNVSVRGGKKHQHPHQRGVAVVQQHGRACPSRQILKLTMRNMMKLPISIQPPARGEADLGQVLVPDAGIELRRDDLDDQEHQDRQRRQDHRRGAAFGGERA